MIACDVALLPPKEIAQKAVDINRTITEKTGNTGIVLDTEKCLPHITLAMGCTDEINLDKIKEILKGIAKDFLPVKLKAISSSDAASAIKIEKTRDIELLHELIVIRMSPFFTHNVTTDMIYGSRDEGIDQITYDYIKKFPVRSSFENYTPHITLAAASADIEIEALEFEASELAICHLGNFCTCRKLL